MNIHCVPYVQGDEGYEENQATFLSSRNKKYNEFSKRVMLDQRHFAPQGHLAVSGDIVGCHNWEG